MNNSTNHINEEFSIFDPTFKYTMAACYILIGVVATIGNSLVCFAILSNKNLRSNPTNLFLFSLAVADLLTVTLAMPFGVQYLFLQSSWRHGKIICVTYVTVYVNSGTNPILTLLVISVDRYKNLKDPLRRFRGKEFMTQRKALIVISIIWISSVVLALLPIMGWRVKGQEPFCGGFCKFAFTELYRVICFTSILVLIIITCVFHLKTYLIARRHQRSVPGFNGIKFLTRNLKALKTTSMFVAAFFVCWQPFTYFWLASYLYGREHWKPYPFKVYVAVQMLYYFNSALNPFLFAFQNDSFKATYVKLFNSLKPTAKPAVDPRSNCSNICKNISSIRDSRNGYQRGTSSGDKAQTGNGERIDMIPRLKHDSLTN